MDERIENWKKDIDEITLNFTHKFDNLSMQQLNWKSSSKHWSIAQVVDHLIVTSESYFDIPNLIRSNNYQPSALAKFGLFPKLFGKLILKSVDPSTSRKIKTGKVFEPSQSKISENILSKFADSQIKLQKFIDDNNEMIENKTIISSPLNKSIVYHFDTVIDIIVNHQKRHFNQAVNILTMQTEGNING